MRKLLYLLIIYVFFQGCNGKEKARENEKKKDLASNILVLDNRAYSLVWFEDFSKGDIPDPNSWTYDVGGHGWGNDELQYYTEASPNNVQINDGVLNIIAQKETFKVKGKTWNYTSARLVSKEAWGSGYFEIRAKLPYGRGNWPAIWMLPPNSKYGPWPSCGELDIMEHVGFNPGVITGSAHTELYNFKIKTQKNAHIEISNPYEFHIYAIKWDSNEIDWYVDGIKYFAFQNEGTGYKTWPFDQKFNILLNIAIGGSWGGLQGVDDSAFPMTMVIDYVKVYQ